MSENEFIRIPKQRLLELVYNRSSAEKLIIEEFNNKRFLRAYKNPAVRIFLVAHGVQILAKELLGMRDSVIEP